MKGQENVATQISNVMIAQTLLMHSHHLSLSLLHSTWCEMLTKSVREPQEGSDTAKASLPHLPLWILPVTSARLATGVIISMILELECALSMHCLCENQRRIQRFVCLSFNDRQASTKWCCCNLLDLLQGTPHFNVVSDTHAFRMFREMSVHARKWNETVN